MRYAQLVVGPAGSGKSTYCAAMTHHAEVENKVVNVVNLDPAAEYFSYQPVADIRDLIHVDDAMDDEELHFGPNGGLVFCMQYLMENEGWLQEQLGDEDDDYVLFDCPGQIELYTHMDSIRQLVECLRKWNFNVCSVFLIDSQFMVSGAKFISGTMAALSVMINLELPHVNVLSKMDLLSKSAKKHLHNFLEPDPEMLLSDLNSEDTWAKKYRKLSEAIGSVIDNFSVVKFLPLNLKDDESIASIFAVINSVIQYGEDADVKVKDFDPIEGEQLDDNADYSQH